MPSIQELKDIRIKKLELLKSKGINPYKTESFREISIDSVISDFSNLEIVLFVPIIFSYYIVRLINSKNILFDLHSAN